MAVTVSEKGQVTIPKELRDRLGIRPGQRIEFTDQDGLLVGRKVVDADPIEAAIGILNQPGSTDEAMEELRGKAELP